MVRPNQIIKSDVEKGTLTFIMFARSEEQVSRRVLLMNFPVNGFKALIQGRKDEIVENIQLFNEGIVNRYAVTINTREI